MSYINMPVSRFIIITHCKIKIFTMKNLPGDLAEARNVVPLTLSNFYSQALFARKLMFRVKLLENLKIYRHCF